MDYKAKFTDSIGRKHTIWIFIENQSVTGSAVIDDKHAAFIHADFSNVFFQIGKMFIVLDEKIRSFVNGERFPPRENILLIGNYTIGDRRYFFAIKRKLFHLEGFAIETVEGKEGPDIKMKILRGTHLKDLGKLFQRIGCWWRSKAASDKSDQDRSCSG